MRRYATSELFKKITFVLASPKRPTQHVHYRFFQEWQIICMAASDPSSLVTVVVLTTFYRSCFSTKALATTLVLVDKCNSCCKCYGIHVPQLNVDLLYH